MHKNRILKTEDAVKQKLGISNFRELSKDKVMELFSIFDEIDPEISKAIIEQFPNFSSTVLDAYREYEDTVSKIVEASKDSSDELFKIYNREIDILEKILEDDLTFDQKMIVADRINKVTKEASNHEKSNKDFLGKIWHGATYVVLGIGAGCLGALGYTKFKK